MPSKALIRAAKSMAEIKKASELGIYAAAPQVDFGKVMGRVQEVIKTIEPHDSVERYSGLGVDCLSGHARLVSPWEVEVDGEQLSAEKIIIATGASPIVPPIPGLDQMDPLTSENLWQLESLPRRLLIVGGGAIGCELAQAFQRLGSQVTLRRCRTSCCLGMTAMWPSLPWFAPRCSGADRFRRKIYRR